MASATRADYEVRRVPVRATSCGSTMPKASGATAPPGTNGPDGMETSTCGTGADHKEWELEVCESSCMELTCTPITSIAKREYPKTWTA